MVLTPLTTQTIKFYVTLMALKPFYNCDSIVRTISHLLKGGCTMTHNQIAYWSLKETERANAAREAETQRSNLAHESLTDVQNRTQERKVEQDFTLGSQANTLTKRRDTANKDIGLSNIALRANELALEEQDVGIRSRQADIAARMATSQARQADAALIQASAATTTSLANKQQANVAAARQDTYDFEAKNKAAYNVVESVTHRQDADTRAAAQKTNAQRLLSDNIYRAVEVAPQYIKSIGSLLVPNLPLPKLGGR